MRIRHHWNSNIVNTDSLICKNCALRLLTDRLIDWWAIQVNELKVIQGPSLNISVFNSSDDRPKCWYGVEYITF